MAQPTFVPNNYASTTSPTWLSDSTDAVVSISTTEGERIVGTVDRIEFVNGSTITSSTTEEPIHPVTSYTYSYDMPTGIVRGTDKKKIEWKWYQPIKNWLKFNLKVLFS